MNRQAKEAYLVNLYREERITHRRLADALGLSRYETDGVLKRYKVSPNVTALEMRAQASAPQGRETGIRAYEVIHSDGGHFSMVIPTSAASSPKTPTIRLKDRQRR